jgi:hypothetical protein
MKIRSLGLWFAAALTACGSSSSSKPDAASGSPDAHATDGGGTTDAAPPPAGAIRLTLPSFDVQPGTERQVCMYVNLPVTAPLDVVEFSSNMGMHSHHFNVYKMLGNTNPVAPADGMVHDCAPASEQLNGNAAYIFGSALPTRVMDLPSGIAFHLLPQQQIILEQHVINATDGVLQGGAYIDLVPAADPTTIQHHADIVWMGNWGFFLPAGQTTMSTQSCAMPYNLEVFGLMSHTHALGTHFSIETITGGNTTHQYDSTDWAHPPYQNYTPLIDIAAGDSFQWTCTWNNTTTHNVMPGKNSTDEMCIAFAYAYPKDTLDATPIECNQPFMP